jgi:hypothetical protein
MCYTAFSIVAVGCLKLNANACALSALQVTKPFCASDLFMRLCNIDLRLKRDYFPEQHNFSVMVNWFLVF